MNTYSNSYREARSKMEIEAIKQMNTMIEKKQETMIEQQKEKYKDTIVWIDIETTGTDPKHDSILQIALIIADKDFNAIEEHEWIVKHKLMDVLSQADDYVKQMHEKTGLWNRIEREGLPLSTIDSHIYSILSKVYDGWKISIGGNSVHFDMNFLTAQLKKSGSLISHRVLDISAVLQYFRVIGDKVELPKHTVSHDAIDDIRWSLTQAKAIKEKINGK